MFYCPYTDKDLKEHEISREHIIPLSLGGIDGFEIFVSKKFNSANAAKIDATLANDFFILMQRNRLDIRGHSRKKPEIKLKYSKNIETQKPLSINFDYANGMKIWDPIKKKEIDENINISSSIRLDINSSYNFLAKVALSAGFYVYGHLFRTSVNLAELRSIMNYDFKTNHDKSSLQKLETRFDDRFKQDNNPDLQVYRIFCELQSDSTIVGFIPGDGCLAIFVSVLGIYIGLINVPADTTNFPFLDEHDLGHIIQIVNGNLLTFSLREAMLLMKKQLFSA